jgi:antitoxin (DNA-binding transcriptional repressor) of toxin-antitoxin stability system
MTMTYTLAMALHPKIDIKQDGVAEVGMTDARAALTSLIREVSWGHRTGAFTERGTRVALVVPPEFFERTNVLRRALELVKARDPGLYEEALAQATVEARTVEGWQPDEGVF